MISKVNDNGINSSSIGQQFMSTKTNCLNASLSSEKFLSSVFSEPEISVCSREKWLMNKQTKQRDVGKIDRDDINRNE